MTNANEREKTRDLAIEYALRGYDLTAIGKHLGLSSTTLSRILKTADLIDAARIARESRAVALPELPEMQRSDMDALRLVRQSIRTVGIEDVLDDLEDSGVHVMLVHAFLRWLRSPETEREAVNIGLATAVLGQKPIGKMLGLSTFETRAAWTIAGEPAPIHYYRPEFTSWWLKYAIRFGTYTAMDLFEEKLSAGERRQLARAAQKDKGRRLYAKHLEQLSKENDNERASAGAPPVADGTAPSGGT